MVTARERDWVMVRVRTEVHARLVRFGKKIATQYAKGRNLVRGGEGVQISHSALIEELLNRDEKHDARSKKAAGKKRAQRRAALEAMSQVAGFFE